jgi:hypothetical protein
MCASQSPLLSQSRLSKTRRYNWLGDLWEEMIEFSTYGPAERKMIKAKRQELAQQGTNDFSKITDQVDKDTKLASYQQKKQVQNDDNSSLSLQSFQSAVAAIQSQKEISTIDFEFDGYALRDFVGTRMNIY